MTSRLTAEAIIFAINSAIKLGRNIRKAYAHSLKSKEIVLPLPDFNPNPTLGNAEAFFKNEDPNDGGAQFLATMPELKALFVKKQNEGLNSADRSQYLDYYRQLSALTDDENKLKRGYQPQDIAALLNIRQWEKGTEPNISALQIMAGTLVEIGIDYFTQVPGALNTDTAHGKILKNFLIGFDNIPFSEPGAFKEVGKLILPKLFVTAAEVIGELSPQITGDIKLQKFIRVTSNNIARDLFDRVQKAGSEREKRETIRWGQTVLYSLVKNAGDYVFASPGNLFRLNNAESKLIKETGQSFLEIILDENTEKVNFKEAFNVESLDSLIRTALSVVAEHPALISKQAGIKNIVKEVSLAVVNHGITRPDIIPELVRLILESTAGNLNLLWPVKDTDAKHLLVIALQQILAAISVKPTPVDPNSPQAKWHPRLSKTQILVICNTLFDEVIHNPEWVTKKIDANSNSLLQEVLESVFKALQQIPFDDRLNFHTVEIIIQTSLRTVASSQIVLTKIKWAKDTEERTILNKALDLIFAFAFQSEQKTNTDRIDLLVDLLDYVLVVVITHNPNQNGLILTQMILFESGIDYANGFNRDLVDKIIASTLSVIAEHPELVAHEEALQHIIGDVAKTLKDTNLHQPALLPEVLRIILTSSAQNAALIIKAQDGTPKYLLVIAFQEILSALSQKPANNNNWHPKLTPTQALFIVERLLDELIHHPGWITSKVDEHSPLKKVLDAIFQALAAIPSNQRIEPKTLTIIVQVSLRALVNCPQILEKMKGGTVEERRNILNKVLNLLFAYIFTTPNPNQNDRTLLLVDLLSYILDVIIVHHPNNKGLILVQLILFEAPEVDYSDGFNSELANQIVQAGLRVISEYPDLATNNLALQSILKDVATALREAGYHRPGLLPEVLRLILESTGNNLNLIITTDPNKPKYLLVVALQEVLTTLTKKRGDTAWHPQLSAYQALEIAYNVLDEVVLNPGWITNQVDGKDHPILKEVLEAIFSALARIPKEERISLETLEWLIRICLSVVVNSPKVLQTIHWTSDNEERIVLNKALELVFACVFKTSNTVNKPELLTDLADYALDAIISKHPNEKGLILLDIVLFPDSGIDYSNGFNKDLADALLDSALKALSEHPELVTDQAGLKNIIREVALALQNSNIAKPDLLPELVRLTLLYTAGNLEIIVKTKRGRTSYLLVIALEQTLKQLAQKPRRGKWKPALTEEQILDIIELILQEVIENPEWIARDKILVKVLRAIFRALEIIPSESKLAYVSFRILLEEVLKVVSIRRNLIIQFVDTDGGSNKLILSYTLEGFFLTLYGSDNQSAGTWALTKTNVLNELIQHFLMRISEDSLNKDAIDKALKIIESAILDINNNLPFTLEGLLAKLENHQTA